MDINNPQALSMALNSGVNLFLGAGFSILAKDQRGVNLPVGGQLAEELLFKFNLQEFTGLSLPQLCTLIESTSKDELNDYLLNRFTVKWLDGRYKKLDLINVKTIYTTNIDNLVHKIYEESSLKYLHDVNFRGAILEDSKAVEFISLHGSVLDNRHKLRFGALDIADAVTTNPDRCRHLQFKLSHYPMIFWGYSMQDAGTLQTIASAIKQNGASHDMWIVVPPSHNDRASFQYYAALNLNVIVADTSQMLDYLCGDAINRAPLLLSSQLPTSALFPQEALPAAGSTPSRPIEEFFSGAPPTWSDVYSGQIAKTRHFDYIREFILSGNNVIITGVPACGKSTLLMQLAVELPLGAHKLVASLMTLEKADLIIRQLDGERAVIFIDNCVDSMSAINKLSARQNIQVIGADRDYGVNTVSHLLSYSNFKIVNITDLSRQDALACVSKVPNDMRKHPFKYLLIEGKYGPSLHEVMESNIRSINLRERFRAALKEFKEKSPEALEVIVLASYVYSCHVPLSMDMLLGYWHDKDYNEVFQLVEGVGRSITEYTGELAVTNQDHFIARSMIVAETVVSLISSTILRDVITRFHENVSIERICNYDVFRRYCYDADIFIRAFKKSEWQVAQEFYEFLYRKDPNFFTLQQAAIFLSRVGRHGEAFTMIDRAIAICGNRNWTVRNSHAIILFRANIEFTDQPNARETLDQSMGILAECYTSDSRKPFHILTYADHAIRYWNAYADEKALSYLETARDGIIKEREIATWVRGFDRLLREIDEILYDAHLD